MIKAVLIGLGKMGLSHCALINSHPSVELVGVCDQNSFVLDAFRKLTKISVFEDYKEMIERTQPDCVFIAAPTKLHHEMVIYSLNKGKHVFCEKPFSLSVVESNEMVELAEKKNLVNQVGYHNRFIGTFNEMKRLVDSKILGDIYHFTSQAYGPVVVRKEKEGTWRGKKGQGGGCLLDYASHVLNLIDFIVGRPIEASGTLLKRIYSLEVEDAVYSSLRIENGLTGQLCVNWSDETYRKMSTSISIQGTNGKMIADATELKIYLKDPSSKENLQQGWTTKYITDLTPIVNYNLRGEEYTAQIDHFIKCIELGKPSDKNSFRTALTTDRIIEKLIIDASKNN